MSTEARMQEALELLGIMYDKWEEGVSCYEDPKDHAGYLGNAFRLSEEEENRVLAVLDRPAPGAPQFEQWWASEGLQHMPAAGEPPQHAYVARKAWDAALAAATRSTAELSEEILRRAIEITELWEHKPKNWLDSSWSELCMNYKAICNTAGVALLRQKTRKPVETYTPSERENSRQCRTRRASDHARCTDDVGHVSHGYPHHTFPAQKEPA